MTHFSEPKAPKNGKNGLKGHIFGAENIETFKWFGINLPIFVKIEDFIAWKCILMDKMS